MEYKLSFQSYILPRPTEKHLFAARCSHWLASWTAKLVFFLRWLDDVTTTHRDARCVEDLLFDLQFFCSRHLRFCLAPTSGSNANINSEVARPTVKSSSIGNDFTQESTLAEHETRKGDRGTPSGWWDSMDAGQFVRRVCPLSHRWNQIYVHDRIYLYAW